MSAEEEAAEEVCASCGKAAVDDVTLKKCACNLVKYCSVDCQKNHRPQHKKLCKKRLAEIRDDRLFTQPNESHIGECPICCLPLPLDMEKSTMMSCCSKVICNGCRYANEKREREQGLEERCLYCREPKPETEEEYDQNHIERVKANDPVAICGVGKKRYSKGDLEGAIQYWTKAAALGDVESHYELAGAYQRGDGVEKDKKKEMYHAEEAAIGGHPKARFHLSAHEVEKGRMDRSMKHLIIAAKQGDDEALEGLKMSFQIGFVSKNEYAVALREHQAAVDATKSKQREEAEKAGYGRVQG